VVLDDPTSVRAAVDGLRRVLDPDRAPAMAEASRRRAVELFDYDRLAGQLAVALS
jgi:hypothetical protein